MPTDPASPFATTTDDRNAERLRDLERRLAVIERANGIVSVGAGPPAAAVTTRFYVDQANHRLYVLDSGSYRYAGLT